MKLESKYFDSIRISRRGAPKTVERPKARCQWKGCKNPATHRAPKGRGGENGHYNFCMDHVRQFNASYNYFSGMSDAEVEEFQKSAVTGHRPTWRMGDGGVDGGTGKDASGGRYARFARQSTADAHGVLGEDDGTPTPKERRRPLKSLERKALNALHLPETASKETIKARFKELVKRNHPDDNGGDRGTEDKLRDIIQAYNYLKQAGLV
ncbi:MAG: J domain-containing protein [Hyphomicrobiaceae bacterium]